MADEEDIAMNEEEKTGGASKGGTKKIVIIAVILLLVGGGGFAGWKFFLSEKFGGADDAATAEAKEAEAEISKVKIMHEMKPFIVNLLGENGTRYLKAKITAEVGDPAIQQELSERDPEVRDAVLLLLAGKSFEDISTPQGRVTLRSELLARMNNILNTGSVQMIYFTEFVVQ